MGYQNRYGQKKKQWHNHTILTIPKGNNMELRFGYSDFGKKHRFDVRQWVRIEETGVMVPTKSGMSILLSEMDSFMAALKQAIPQVQEYAMQRESAVQQTLEADSSFLEGMNIADVRSEPKLNPDDLKGDDVWG